MELKSVVSDRNKSLGLFMTLGVLTSLIADSALGQCLPAPDAVTDQKSMPLLAQPDSEYMFYYRIPRGPTYVVYLPAASVRAHLSKYRPDAASELMHLLPLEDHTDIFQPFLTDSFDYILQFFIADVLESGDAAVWTEKEGFLGTVQIDYYLEDCATGRRFRDLRGVIFFQVEDSIN